MEINTYKTVYLSIFGLCLKKITITIYSSISLKPFPGQGLEGISSEDPLLIELEEMPLSNKQIFYISDAILLDMLFISKSVHSMFGIEPENVPQGFFPYDHHSGRPPEASACPGTFD